MSAKEPPKTDHAPTGPRTPTESCLPTASIRFWNAELFKFLDFGAAVEPCPDITITFTLVISATQPPVP